MSNFSKFTRISTRRTSLIERLVRVANALDNAGMYRDAETLDTLAHRIANLQDIQQSGQPGWKALGRPSGQTAYDIRNYGQGVGQARLDRNWGHFDPSKENYNPATGPQLRPGMTQDEMLEAQNQWYNNNPNARGALEQQRQIYEQEAEYLRQNGHASGMGTGNDPNQAMNAEFAKMGFDPQQLQSIFAPPPQYGNQNGNANPYGNWPKRQ